MPLHKDLDKLIEAKVIDEATARAIADFYSDKTSAGSNRLLNIFAVIGALLLGLGVILIVAHNWDSFPKATKTFFAFLPLALGQGACLCALWKRPGQVSWMEGSAVFLALSIGACIALISQVYQLQGELDAFMLTWCLLGLPLAYLLRSSTTSLLYHIGICIYAFASESFINSGASNGFYFLLFLAALPYYGMIIRTTPHSLLTVYHHYILPLCFFLALLPFLEFHEHISLVLIALFGLYILIGQTAFFKAQGPVRNGYHFYGTLGTLITLLVVSSGSFWSGQEKVISDLFGFAPVGIVFVALTVFSIALLVWSSPKLNALLGRPISLVFLLYPLVYLIGGSAPVLVSILINLLLLWIAIKHIWDGVRQTDLRILNSGLLIIAAQMVVRFLDTDLSFIQRGLIFMIVGAGFFLANYSIIRKRRSHEA